MTDLIEADTIVMAGKLLANIKLSEELSGAGSLVYMIGDCAGLAGSIGDHDSNGRQCSNAIIREVSYSM